MDIRFLINDDAFSVGLDFILPLTVSFSTIYGYY